MAQMSQSAGASSCWRANNLPGWAPETSGLVSRHMFPPDPLAAAVSLELCDAEQPAATSHSETMVANVVIATRAL